VEQAWLEECESRRSTRQYLDKYYGPGGVVYEIEREKREKQMKETGGGLRFFFAIVGGLLTIVIKAAVGRRRNTNLAEWSSDSNVSPQEDD